MPLEQKFTLNRSADKQNLLVTDTTGAYDATTNPGGYGGVNPDVGDFFAFAVAVYLPDPDTLLPQTTAVPITAIYPTLPSATGATYTITSTALVGSTSDLIDGQYRIITSGTYDVGGGDVAATPITVNNVFYSIAECCILKLRADTPLCGDCEECEGKNAKLDRSFSLLYMLSPQVNSVGEVVDSYIQENELWNLGVQYLNYLQEVCDSANCGQPCGGC